ncbi:TonB-dependent receptor [Methylonatrum kenyense]|uniref:TonB-dependent receptor domain-containing protein n=1 Tax=Methylonatrum kenyense TaxID=455253 RepID=UPI0020BFCF04|nr:TonB-dependent receptor [Methylonatrum kenyense]MCK8515378.1 TonB-dependent receptor [Methylonatrum kenyense]
MQGDILPRLAGAAAFAVPFTLAAETTTDQPMLAAASINPIVVTPTLTARTVDETLSSVTVIDRERIDRQQPRELSDLLRGQAGLDLTTNGAFGKNTSVFTRGTGSESTVLLIDGIRMNSATGGAPAWQFLPPQLLDRVEVVRGPRSSIYGSDAVGGVVQAFTPEGDGEPAPWVQIGGGSFRQQEVGAGVSGSEGNTRYSIAHNYFETDGIRIRRGDERKGFRNNATVGRLSHGFEAGPELGLTGFRSSGTTEFDGGRTEYRLQALGARAAVPVTAWWDALLTLSESRDEADTEDDFGTSRFDTKRREARVQNNLYLDRHELVLGGDFRRDMVDSTTDFDERRRDNTGAFAQLFVDGGDLDIQLAGRWDDNDAFGEETTGSVAAGYQFDQRHRARASFGTAFRAPTFNDLFFPGFGNPDLSPERSRSTELGFRASQAGWFWDLSVYQTDVRNLIVFDSVSFRPENVDRARIRGAELAAGGVIDDWTLQGSVSVTDPRDRETRNRIRRRSTHSLRLEADRQLGNVSLGATALYQGDRYDDAGNTDRLSGFALFNARASWEFAENWSTRLTVDNVLDRDYAVARFSDGEPYQQAGRSAFLSVRYGHR